MNSRDGEQKKRAKWSRWVDNEAVTDDEDSGNENCRRIVNETTLLGVRNCECHDQRPSAKNTGKMRRLQFIEQAK